MQTQSRLLLIRVCVVCNSLCILWMHNSKETPSCSTYRVITTNVLGVRIFRKLTISFLWKAGKNTIVTTNCAKPLSNIVDGFVIQQYFPESWRFFHLCCHCMIYFSLLTVYRHMSELFWIGLAVGEKRHLASRLNKVCRIYWCVRPCWGAWSAHRKRFFKECFNYWSLDIEMKWNEKLFSLVSLI